MKNIFTFCFLILACHIAEAKVITGTDELAHLPYWELHAEAMTFRIVQRLPDQTRAYFSGRGFSKEDAEYVAGYCVFQTILTNTSSVDSPRLINYDASQWLVRYKGKQQSLVLREDWRSVWQQRKADKPQRIAFEWSLLPTVQQYQPADYNWGMTTYKLPHGSTFDLKIFWTLDGDKRTATIENLQCAKDVYMPPPAEQ